MTKFRLTMVLCAGAAVLAMGCGSDAGCDALAKKLESCGSSGTVQCDDSGKAQCVADKLDATCSNLIAATLECA